jgi:hypothetical protein
MAEEQKKSPDIPEDVNPIFELYTLLKDVEDPRFTDAEIRNRLKELKPKLKILFAPVPPSQK